MVSLSRRNDPEEGMSTSTVLELPGWWNTDLAAESISAMATWILCSTSFCWYACKVGRRTAVAIVISTTERRSLYGTSMAASRSLWRAEGRNPRPPQAFTRSTLVLFV
jgi:hypothetical protein